MWCSVKLKSQFNDIYQLWHPKTRTKLFFGWVIDKSCLPCIWRKNVFNSLCTCLNAFCKKLVGKKNCPSKTDLMTNGIESFWGPRLKLNLCQSQILSEQALRKWKNKLRNLSMIKFWFVKIKDWEIFDKKLNNSCVKPKCLSCQTLDLKNKNEL